MEDRRALSAKPTRWLRVNRAGLFCAAVFAVLYSAIALYRYSHFVWTSWDLGIFTQIVSSYSHLEAPTVPIRGVGFTALGDHFSPALAVLAVPYSLLPDPTTLLVAQAVLLAWSILPISSARVASPRVLAGPRGHRRIRRVLRGGAGGSRRLSRGRSRRTTDGVRRRRTRGPALAEVVIASLPLVLVKEDLGVTVAAIGLVCAVRAAAGSARYWLPSAWPRAPSRSSGSSRRCRAPPTTPTSPSSAPRRVAVARCSRRSVRTACCAASARRSGPS